MSHTMESAIEMVEELNDSHQREAQEILAKQVLEARNRLYNLESDLVFATDENNTFEVKYAIERDASVVVFENFARTRKLEVQVKTHH